MGSILILTDDKIISVLKNVNLYSAFPALQTINKSIYEAPKKAGCSKCMRNKVARATESVTTAVKAFKDYIKRLDNATRGKLKEALNCSELRFNSVGNDGRLREYRY